MKLLRGVTLTAGLLLCGSAQAQYLGPADLWVPSLGTVDFGAADVNVTHSSNALTVIGAAQLNLDDELELRLFEEDGGGTNYVGFKAPAALTASVTCTFENDANPIPDSCVGDGSDGGGGSDGLGPDGDVGDITIGGSGTTANIDGDATISAATPVLTIVGTDAGAAGPIMVFQHDSSSPVVSDTPFDLRVLAGADDEEIGRLDYRLIDGTTTTEDGAWEFRVDVAGTTALQASIGAGMIIGTGTTFPGAGNLGFGSLAAIDFNAGDVVFTHRANGITITGASATDGALSMDLDANVGWRAFDVTNINTGSSAGAGMSVQNGTVFAEFSAYSFGNWAAVETESGDMRVGTEAADDLVFRTNDTIRWTVDQNGDISGANGNSIDLNESAAAGWIGLDITNSSTNAASGTGFYVINGNGTAAALEFSAYHAGNWIAMISNAGDLRITTLAATDDIQLRVNNTLRWTVDGTAGHFLPATDGAIDIGTSAVGIDDLYIGGATGGLFTDAGSQIIVGNTAALATIDGSQTPSVQILGAGASGHDQSSLALLRFGSNAFSPVLTIGKSRAATVGSYTVVQNDDQVGHVAFEATDGTAFDGIASVSAYIDSATIATDSVPGRLEFTTQAVGGTSALGRWRISNGGEFTGPLADDPQAVFTDQTATPIVQVLGLSANHSTVAIAAYTNDAVGPELILAKSRGTIVGNETIVQSGDDFGAISFQGSDGDQSFNEGALIWAEPDGTMSAGSDMPGRLLFGVSADGTDVATAWLVIKNDGAVVIGDNDAGMVGAGLHVDDNYFLRLYEAEANGDNYQGFVTAAAVTASTTCTFEDDSNFIPDSCVGDGSDASDARLKTITGPAGDVGPLLDSIKIYNYEWNRDLPEVSEAVRKGKAGFGPVAQELYKVLPDAVHVGGLENTDPWTWKPEKLVPYLLVEIQNLRKRVDELEGR
jgi:hypothetical protein